MFRRIPEGTHNSRPWGDGVLCNDTNGGRLALIDRAGQVTVAMPVPAYDPASLVNADLPEDHARQRFNRGLCPLDDDLVAVGSSPANVSLFSRRSRERLTTVTLSHDLRNAIHGLEIWPLRLRAQAAGWTWLTSGWPAARRSRLSAITAKRRAIRPSVQPEPWGVMTTLSSSWKGWREGRTEVSAPLG